MGHRTILDSDGKQITVDENGMFVNTTNYDWTYGVTTDRIEMESAAKSARGMVSILESAAAKGGFDEGSCLALLQAFLIVGQWTRGSGYAAGAGLHFTFHRQPRTLGAGQKFSGLLLHFTKRFATAFDPKDRRQAFDEMQALMFDFVWSMHLRLLKENKARGDRFGKALRDLVTKDWRRQYRFHW
jgi:hypothetical protein